MLKKTHSTILMNSIISVEVLCISLWNCKEKMWDFFVEALWGQKIMAHLQLPTRCTKAKARISTLYDTMASLHSLSVTILSWAVFKDHIIKYTHCWPFLHCGCRLNETQLTDLWDIKLRRESTAEDWPLGYLSVPSLLKSQSTRLHGDSTNLITQRYSPGSSKDWQLILYYICFLLSMVLSS